MEWNETTPWVLWCGRIIQRLEKAKELLKDETQKVKDVGAMVGYESSAHFVSIFRKKFGMTPNEYRRIILEGKNMVQKRNGKNT